MNQSLLLELALRFENQFEPTFNKVKESFYKGNETDFEIIKFDDLDFESVFQKHQFRKIDKFHFVAIVYKYFMDMIFLFECEPTKKELEILEKTNVSSYNESELNNHNYYKKSNLEDLKRYENSYYIKNDSTKKEQPLIKKLNEFYENIMVIANVLRGELIYLSGTEDKMFEEILKDLDFDLGIEFKSDESEKTSTKYNLSLNKDKGAITDLKELLYVIAQSKLICNNDKPITHKELTKVFNELLGTSIDVEGPTDGMNKRSLDNTFIKRLNDTMTNYLVKSPKK